MNAIEEMKKYLDFPSISDGVKIRTKCSLMLERIEQEFIELPKDKNGETITLGDEVVDWGGYRFKVEGYLYRDGEMQVCGAGFATSSAAARCRICKPDTWERIEEDCKLFPCDYVHMYPECFSGFDSDGHAQRKDIIRRCKKLAGVE